MYRVTREQWMDESLAKRKDEGTLRELRTAEADKCFMDFTSNDYLGLGRSEELGQLVKHEEARILQVRNSRERLTLPLRKTRYLSQLSHPLLLPQILRDSHKPCRSLRNALSRPSSRVNRQIMYVKCQLRVKFVRPIDTSPKRVWNGCRIGCSHRKHAGDANDVNPDTQRQFRKGSWNLGLIATFPSLGLVDQGFFQGTAGTLKSSKSGLRPSTVVNLHCYSTRGMTQT